MGARTLVVVAIATCGLTSPRASAAERGPAAVHPVFVTVGENVPRQDDWQKQVTEALGRYRLPPPQRVTVADLPDSDAGLLAGKQGAAFALVATPLVETRDPAAPTIVGLSLYLVDATTGLRRNATFVPNQAEPGTLDAAIMRLDEEARRATIEKRPGLQITAPGTGGQSVSIAVAEAEQTPAAPAGPQLQDNPQGWARGHMPLLIAIGLTVASALVLGLAVAAGADPARTTNTAVLR